MATYCTLRDIQRRLSVPGVALHIDDDPSVYPSVIEEASVQMDEYLLRHYTAAQLQASTWATYACSLIAACLLMERRGNSPPRSMRRKLEALMEKLEGIDAGTMHVPGLARIRTAVPLLSQPRIRLDPVPRTVIERGRGSSRHHPRDYSQRKDNTENPGDYSI